MIRLSANKYMELLKDYPSHQMVWSGWNYSIKYFLGFPYVIYTK
jgi:hypothetical protein